MIKCKICDKEPEIDFGPQLPKASCECFWAYLSWSDSNLSEKINELWKERNELLSDSDIAQLRIERIFDKKLSILHDNIDNLLYKHIGPYVFIKRLFSIAVIGAVIATPFVIYIK